MRNTILCLAATSLFSFLLLSVSWSKTFAKYETRILVGTFDLVFEAEIQSMTYPLEYAAND